MRWFSTISIMIFSTLLWPSLMTTTLIRHRCCRHDRLLQGSKWTRSSMMICQHSTKCFRALSSCYQRWTSPIRCGHLHQSNSVSRSDSGWHDPRHHVPKRYNAASVLCIFQWDYIAMLGLSGGGTGNTQTDRSKSNMPADVDFVLVDFASQFPPTR
jgi:hypothetical protein